LEEVAMRWIVVCAALMASVVARVEAEGMLGPAKDAVTDTAIVSMCGARMAKMFAQYGAPQDLWADRGATEAEDDVYLGYGAYGFKVRDKVVRVCFFFRTWQGPVRGVKIGDGLEDVVKLLGNPRTTVKDKNGAVTAYGYELKDLDAIFFANFKDGKVWRVEVSLK
jgi:hypothetical protein